MPGTVIKLYSCYKCGWIMDEDQTNAKDPCKRCSSNMMRPAAPTKWNIVRYFFNNPKMLKVLVLENVFKRNR